eukprot:scaffold63356_cov63-Phaeocystis_antarctica.AAC.1
MKVQRQQRPTTTRVVFTPAWPTMVPRRRKRITPRMFWQHGTKTPMNVPNFFASAAASGAEAAAGSIISAAMPSVGAGAPVCTEGLGGSLFSERSLPRCEACCCTVFVPASSRKLRLVVMRFCLVPYTCATLLASGDASIGPSGAAGAAAMLSGLLAGAISSISRPSLACVVGSALPDVGALSDFATLGRVLRSLRE